MKKRRNRKAQDTTLINLDAVKKRLDRIERLLGIKKNSKTKGAMR